MAKRSKVAKHAAPRRFTLFPNLPKELRLKVWEAAIVPRIIEVCQAPEEQDIESESEEDDEETNQARFYSSTALPVILHVNQESRAIALKNYTLSFPNGPKPAQIYYNPSIDLLYFPAWCFGYNIFRFERTVSPESKDKIRRIAIENLMWFGGIEEGTINNQIHIGDFKNLDEFLLVSRNPDAMGCGCCHEFDGPERGMVEFKEMPEEGRAKGSKGFFQMVIKECGEEFERIKEKDKDWKVPEVRFVQLTRDGVLI